MIILNMHTYTRIDRFNENTNVKHMHANTCTPSTFVKILNFFEKEKKKNNFEKNSQSYGSKKHKE